MAGPYSGSNLTIMSFIKIKILWHLLWVIPFLIFISLWAARKRYRILAHLLGKERAEHPSYSTLSKGKRHLRIYFFSIAIILLVIAVARPYWGMRILPFSGRGRDIMIVLDVSKSMLAKDIQPSRLEHAKWFLRELISSTTGDRYGIVAFAGNAFPECPLTPDKTTLLQTLNEVSPDSIPLGGTNIQKALETALEAFKAAEGGHRAVILVSDGDELQGDSSKVLNRLKVPLFVVGIGDPSQPGLIMLSEKDGETTFLRDHKGELVKSRLNEAQLSRLAAESGGIYVRSTTTDTGIKPILKRVLALVPEEYSSGKNTRPIDRFHIPLFAAVVLLMAHMAISERRRMLPVILSLVLMPAAFAVGEGKESGKDQLIRGDSPDGETQQGDTASSGMPKEAGYLQLKETEKPVGRNSDVDFYNQALDLHENKNSKDAVELYEQAINLAQDNPEVRSKSFQNLGVISHEQARDLIFKEPDKALKILDYAEEMYRESMRAEGRTEVALNQQMLINDRELGEQAKKQKGQLEKKREKAQKDVQDALDSTRHADTDQQNEQKEKDVESKTEDAKKSVEDYKNEAAKQNQKDAEQSAGCAEGQLEKAHAAQKKNDYKTAEENLEKALKELGGKEGKKENSKKKEGHKKEEDQRKKSEQEVDKTVQRPTEQPPSPSADASNGKQERDIDPAQADALIDLMANDEKTLRDALREEQRRNSRLKPLDKDW